MGADAVQQCKAWQAKKADAGFAAITWPKQFGGREASPILQVIYQQEEDNYAVPRGLFEIGLGMCIPTMMAYARPEQLDRYVRPALHGEEVWCQLFSEPAGGSDLAALRTRAERDGDDWVINGSKLYITNGTQADWLCLLARTSGEGGYRGMSQIVFPTSTPGFSVSRKLRKLGNKSSDTAELSFTDARVPVRNTIGEIGRGFQQQMTQFQNERMIAAYMAVGGMERALALTAAYLRDRQTFGAPLLSRQYVQFRLAELAADLDTLKHYNYACAEAYLAGRDTTRFATIAKLKAGRLHREIADTCLQFHGGFGYMEESWVSRYFRDSRLMSIGGGSDEVMLSILARLDGFAG
jgi:citronellyl-CoA dehydrogenase